MLENTKALSLSALMAALGTALLSLTGLLPTLRLMLVCAAGLLTLPARLRFGKRWGLSVWAVTFVLALLLAPEKDAVLLYGLFAGWYPMLKLHLERMEKSRRMILKAAVFLGTSAILYMLSDLLFAGALPVARVLLPALCFVLCWIYDYALTQAILIYMRKIAGRINHG